MAEQSILDAATLRGWRKSSYSDPNGGSCVEIIDDDLSSGVSVRDSKNPHGPALIFATTDWSAFITAAKDARLMA